ncbi:PIN domain nuclease [Glycomyces tenuis]|uniref:PIN domain nuclease n=1 Tax=Glycomyces tenuis TaxID=58116 RepID=UPI000426AC9C|nr:PIN domain nuclease [Glycomyces tenuis]
MSPARYLIDTSALSRLLLKSSEEHGWDRAAEAGLIALCSVVELEYLYGARSWADRQRLEEVFIGLFGWVPMDDRMFRRAVEVQQALTRRGQHRSAGPVDLLVAATAELHDLSLLHRDRDFECIAAVTGQPLEWFGPDRSG